MRMERVNENQIKFFLTQNDLVKREIKLTELAYGSDKARELFREMMEQAFDEYGFETEEGTPLMIEAVPTAKDSLMIIITKVSGEDLEDGKFNMFPSTKDQERFKKKSIDGFLEDKVGKSFIIIYSFNNLDDIMDLSRRLLPYYDGKSSVYKLNNLYYLVLEGTSAGSIKDLNPVLNEYGTKHVSDIVTKYYLVEHGESIIDNEAVEKLSTI